VKRARRPAMPTPPSGEVAAVWMDISALTEWDKNPRKNGEAVGPLMRSIKRFGFGAPILARKANLEIIGGHTRLEAALKLGLERVPVRLLDISEEDAHRLALADNKLGELAEWNEERLVEFLREMDPIEIEETGFSEKELSKMLGLDDDTSAAPDGYTPIYQVLIECRDEDHQRETLQTLAGMDIECKALIA
jgi:hypothetical protein